MDELSVYRFFGVKGTITLDGVEIALTRYGQKVEGRKESIDAKIAADPPALLMPEELFFKSGITEEQLAAHPSAADHAATAPPELLATFRNIRLSAHEHREALLVARSAPNPAGGFGKQPAAAVAKAPEQAPEPEPKKEPEPEPAEPEPQPDHSGA